MSSGLARGSISSMSALNSRTRGAAIQPTTRLPQARFAISASKYGRPELIARSLRTFRSSEGNASQREVQHAPSVREALSTGQLGIGFSAGGLLFPYFLGCVRRLREGGVLTDSTPVAGASAGSLIAACSKVGLSHDELVTATLELAAECRRLGTRHNLGPILDRTLQRMLPDDAHERANAGNVHVAVTRLSPRAMPTLISRFESRDDLIGALLTSCHIPWYLNGSWTTRFRGSAHCDGGLTNFLPAPHGAARTVRVCCFPSRSMSRLVGSPCITPDTFEEWPHNMRTMLGWALAPADDATLLGLVEKGERDAAAWLEAHVHDAALGGEGQQLPCCPAVPQAAPQTQPATPKSL